MLYYEWVVARLERRIKLESESLLIITKKRKEESKEESNWTSFCLVLDSLHGNKTRSYDSLTICAARLLMVEGWSSSLLKLVRINLHKPSKSKTKNFLHLEI